jgi:hypothetical protein
VTGVIALFCVSVTAATDCVAVTALLTVSEKVLDADALFVSVMVTVYVCVPLVAVGMPVMAPVEVLKLSPVGSDGEIP